jgi:demethylmenaquinone methyltransferase/2-methoxy-6-polyprenyl-1,4-benzoquinol methylase
LAEEKLYPEKRPLYTIFTAVPPHYDLINRIFTFGLDESWRRQAAQTCLNSNPKLVLDLCCGTGDLALCLASLAQPGTEIIGIDYSQSMLSRAREKADGRLLNANLQFIHADVGDMPFPNGFFDSIGISFAFRNLTYKNPKTQNYLAEVVRVLKPGGEFVIVESSQPRNKLVRTIAHIYLRMFVYRLGSWISKNRPAYKYLTESARNFYTAEELSDLLVNAGFKSAEFKRLFFGAAALHRAVK